MKSFLLLATIAVLVLSASADSPRLGPIERLDGSAISAAQATSTMNRLMKAAAIPGAALAVFNDGRLVYLNAFGTRDKSKHQPMTVDTVMYAASFTKPAFAYMVMQLADEGVLELDRPVYEYLPKALPEYPEYADLAGDERYKRITTRMLLDHTSGFANFRWLEDDKKLRIHFDPGTRYAYSGEGMNLLQLVVETITRKSLAELMDSRVFKPLGMTRTSMVWQGGFENDAASGYDQDGRALGPQRREKANAAGSMVTTISDYSRFLQAVMAGRGLRPKVRDLMLSPQIAIVSKHQFPTLDPETTDANKAIRLSYGLGWGLYSSPYGPVFFKEGHDDGWRNYAVCFDQRKTALIVMTNSGNGEGIYQELLETVIGDNFTPIEWEGFTPYNQQPQRAKQK